MERWRLREPRLEVSGASMGGEDAIRWLEHLKEEILTGDTVEGIEQRELTEEWDK